MSGTIRYLKIKSCGDCPHRRTRRDYLPYPRDNTYEIVNVCDQKSKELLNLNKIPDWCPLPKKEA